MAGSDPRTTVFEDFSGGEAGTLDLSKVPANFYNARNMLVYRNGSLGPRPGLRAHPLGRAPAGPIDGLGYVEAGARSLIYMDNGTFWTADPSGVAAAVSLGAAATKPNPRWPITFIDRYAETGYAFVSNGGKVFRLNPLAGTKTDSGQLGGATGTVYGIRLLRSENTGKRFFFSAPDNMLSWPAANFIDVTLSSDIVFMAEQRGHMVIVTDDGSWWVMTGVPGINETLRRISGGRMTPSQMAPSSFVDVGDDLIHYLSPVNNYPGSFDGATHKEIPYLSMTPDQPLVSYASGTRDQAYNEVCAFQGADNGSPAFVLRGNESGFLGRMLLMHNGSWNLHDFGVKVSHLWASNGRGRIYGFTRGASDTGTSVLTTELRLDRPAFTSDANARPGDDTNTPLDCHVTFPEQWSEDGDELRVKEVMVDFVRWNTGAAETNRIQAEVTALATGSEVPSISNTVTWEQAGSKSPATQTGVSDRIKMGFGGQGTGAGWRLKLAGLRGVAIRRVSVVSAPVKSNRRIY